MNPATKLELLYNLYVIGCLNKIIMTKEGLQLRQKDNLAIPPSYEDFKVEFEEMLKRNQWTESYVYEQCKSAIDFMIMHKIIQ